jgi:hypothetical protein
MTGSPNGAAVHRARGPNDIAEVLENIGAGEGNRTLVFSLEGCCSTIELHPHTKDELTRRASRLNRPAGLVPHP